MRRCGHSRPARGLLLGGLLLLAACAQPAPAPEVAPLPYPPSVRARIQHFALGEWQDWGGVTLDATTRPPSTNAEAAIENFPRVLAYWRAVPQGRRAIAENRPLYAAALAGDPDGAGLWRERAADAGRFRPMHCDIVVATGPSHVDVIGGNVLDAVTRTRFPTDAAGILLPERPGAPVWFALFRNRLGRLPPWSNTP